MEPGKHRSFWLKETLRNTPNAAPSLDGDTKADVAIIGGGYVGLWTAIRIKELEPECDVVLLEQDVCGGGASGRNGGFAISWWAKIGTLAKLFGSKEGVRLARESAAAISEIETFCRLHQIKANFQQSGWLWTATTKAQLGAWQSSVDTCERLGVDAFSLLPAAEVAQRTGSSRHLAGVLDRTGATVQPAALARGLRGVALSLGVRIYEQTRMLALKRDYPPVVTAPSGRVSVGRVVIAMNGWAASLPELRRAIVVVSSDMLVTAPIPERLAQIGWVGGEGITDSQQMVTYYRTTCDGRIAFGKGGWGIALGGRISRAFDRNTERLREVKADFHRVYPVLADVGIEEDWSGAVDRSASGLPILGRLGGRDHLLYGVGWSGNGVAPSVLGGKILASLALGRKDEWSRYPLVDQPFGRFPPDPIRYLGAHMIREAVRRKERAEARGHSPSRLAAALSKLAPAGLEDH